MLASPHGPDREHLRPVPLHRAERRTEPGGTALAQQSPVGDESVFSIVDLYGVSTGVSLNWTHLSGSIGVVYEWGDQGIALSPSSSLPGVNGELAISSFHLLWGLTYKF